MKKDRFYGINDILTYIFVLFVPSLILFIVSLCRINKSGGIPNAGTFELFSFYIFIPINVIFISFIHRLSINSEKDRIDSNCLCLTINRVENQKRLQNGLILPISKIRVVEIIKLTKDQKKALHISYSCLFSTFLKITTMDEEEKIIYVPHFSKRQLIKIKEMMEIEKKRQEKTPSI